MGLEIGAVAPTHVVAPSTTGWFDCQGQVAPEVPIIRQRLVVDVVGGQWSYEEVAIAEKVGIEAMMCRRGRLAELVALGELSSARQALEGGDCARHQGDIATV